MNAMRIGLITLVLSCLFSHSVQADVRQLNAVQTLTRPASPTFTNWGQDVAIDGAHIIVLAAYDGGQQALLYRRSSSTGQWSFRRVLATWTGPFVRAEVAMRNGIAAVQFGNQISLFEYSGGDYVRTSGAARCCRAAECRAATWPTSCPSTPASSASLFISETSWRVT